MAPPLAQSSPPGKEDQGRGETERERGKKRSRSRRGFWRVAAAVAKISTGDKMPGVMGLAGLGFKAQENH